MTDIADLVAKLDADIAWIDARRESGHGMWPTDIKFSYADAVELRRIVAAAAAYVEAKGERDAALGEAAENGLLHSRKVALEAEKEGLSK